MALGTFDFKPAKGDLVKVISDGIPFIAKGSIARIARVYEERYYLERHPGVPIDLSQLEVLAYRERGGTDQKPEEMMNLLMG